MPTDEEIERAIAELLRTCAPGRSIAPEDAARRVAGADWRSTLGRVRRIAAAMMKRGELSIVRKGRPVDPDDIRGVVRFRPAGGGPHASDDD